MTRATGYIRVSKKIQVVEGDSLENQKFRIENYCELNNLELINIISDEGISGRRTKNRKGYIELMDIVKEKKTDCIIVYSLSRFARSTIETLRSIKEMDKNKIDFVSLNESIDTKTAFGKFFLTILSGLAELESEIISERTKSVLQYKKRNGQVYSPIPLGYIEKDGKIISNGEMHIIEKIFKLHETTSYSGIARILNEQKVMTKNKKKFYASTIRYILNNKLYQK